MEVAHDVDDEKREADACNNETPFYHAIKKQGGCNVLACLGFITGV